MALTVDRSLTAEAAEELRALYDSHPGWAGRTIEEVRTLIRNSDEVVGLWETNAESESESKTLVASARVLTDYVMYGMIYEVIVAESRRRTGLGKRVMEAVVTHPELEGVALSLQCREGLVPFYEACGFELHDRNIEFPEFPDGDPVTYRTMMYERE
ncbi:GNAT family N-acetyltransferase [Halegenticoccus soli]|uniref:GNAT family N-acetyltransferase n=1 Tax=Halegenticoccus soli TaxID=1985678 RepID=UPI000C6C95DC|nr:GNAT family N-acetyltransferase [Halegenticoccus soli]